LVVDAVDPSPKFHAYVVEELVLLDVFVKLHVSPEQDLEKLAVRTGGGGGGGGAPLPMNPV
jgi:hypothetical protein